MQHLDGIEYLKAILRTKYDQYSSLILPLQKYLLDHGVKFVPDTTVTDMELHIESEKKTVTALALLSEGNASVQPVKETDIVYFTNGSMTQNSTRGSMTEAPVMNTDTESRGCFTLWEKLAAKSADFGHPEKFVCDPVKSNFVSTTVTFKDYPQFFEYLEKKTGNKTGTGGVTTFVDSPWYINCGAALQPLFPDQPDNVQVLFIYGLHFNDIGTYVKKPMNECSGEEILKEFCYFCGLSDKFEEIRSHSIAIPTVMPYITSQFMPRAIADRPQIIPNGCVNLAFIGQFVELPGDVVFTVETSVRTAMMAVYKTMHLDKPITEIFPAQYDIRICITCLKKLLGKETLSVSDLPKVNPLKLPQMMHQLVDGMNAVPKMTETYPERVENK